jgi:hypothetical protein
MIRVIGEREGAQELRCFSLGDIFVQFGVVELLRGLHQSLWSLHRPTQYFSSGWKLI